MKKILFISLVLILLMSCIASAEAPEPIFRLGDKMEDFSVVTADGETFTLSEVLREKDMVLINFWATWCGSCCREFPAMNEAYLRYQDQVEVIALSIDAEDTPDVIREFAESEGLSLNMAQDTPDLYTKFAFEAIPTSLVVDRFGTICFIGGVLAEAEDFIRLFDAFVGEDYESSVILTEVPPEKPHMAPSPEAELTAALEASAFNLTDEYTWPMLVSEEDGRSVVVSSNAGVANTTAAVNVKTEANAGDAIVVTFKTSSEAAADLLSIRINGETVKVFGGEHDWSSYAWPVEQDGAYDILLSYDKDPYIDAGEDMIWIDSVSVLSGSQADAAIAANPVYPVGDGISILPVECEAKEIFFEDGLGTLALAFPETRYYIVDRDSVKLHATLPADVDPEIAFFSHMFEGSFFGLTTCMTEDGYELVREVESVPEGIIPFTAVVLGLDASLTNSKTVVLFRNEENVDQFLKDFELTDGWYYADVQNNPGSVKALAAGGEVSYTIRCVDQNGAAVEGVSVQLCDDVSCRAVRTDADGLYSFTSAPSAWEVHVLNAPEGYSADSDEILRTTLAGGEITLTLTRE